MPSIKLLELCFTESNKNILFRLMSISDNQLRQYIDMIFSKYDRDNSGSLDARELAGFFNDLFAMMKYNMVVNDAQAMQAIRSIDKNNDGRASKMELFMAFKAISAGGNPGQPQQGYGQQQNYGQQPNYGQQQRRIVNKGRMGRTARPTQPVGPTRTTKSMGKPTTTRSMGTTTAKSMGKPTARPMGSTAEPTMGSAATTRSVEPATQPAVGPTTTEPVGPATTPPMVIPKIIHIDRRIFFFYFHIKLSP